MDKVNEIMDRWNALQPLSTTKGFIQRAANSNWRLIITPSI